MSRADEIAQGLRDETGALIGGLDVLDFAQGWEDYEAGAAWPKLTSPSYDIGRTRASERAEEDRALRRRLARESEEGDARMRLILADRPDVLAKYEADMARIRERAP